MVDEEPGDNTDGPRDNDDGAFASSRILVLSLALPITPGLVRRICISITSMRCKEWDDFLRLSEAIDRLGGHNVPLKSGREESIADFLKLFFTVVVANSS